MGFYNRSDYSGGWQPSSDAFNASKNALLRMDNLMLDERGVLALRQGSAKINSSAFSDVDVHSLFTATLSGTRYRMSGATDAVYANGTSIASSVNSSGDIAFGAHMGQILFARGTTKKKYDGTTVRTWGIAAPGGAATLAVIAADSKVFASCSSAEAPGMTSNEGTQSFQPDKAGTANAAVQIIPDSTTGRGTSTLTYAAPTDFTAYSGGQTGTDDDLIDFYAYITEPQYMDTITWMVDVNDGTFQEDYYQYTFRNGDAIEVELDQEQFLAGDYTAEGFDREEVLSKIENRNQVQANFRADKPVSNAGWNHFSVPRGKMERHGSTAGKNWSTVQAVRITFQGIAGGSGAAVRFDAFQIVGGSARPLTGKYKAIVVAVRNDNTYQALSAPNTASAEIEVKAQGIRATLASGVVNALDSQVTELWLYLMGGRVDAYYRYGTLTGGPFSGAQNIDATSSDRTALITNIRLETDSTTPPSTIIGIEGPHYDRTLCLTATGIYPSRRLNPDSYSAGEVVTVGDAAETALWIKKSREVLYCGTTRDIYRFDGDWTPLPDGTINVFKVPLGVSSPPISAAVAVGTINGAETLVYLTGDGWHALGIGSLTAGAVDLLWRGFTRHGVSPVNVATSTARFRCALTKNLFWAITPEGDSTTSSATLHVYHFGTGRWYRFTYPQAFRSIHAEADGTLIAGDAAGFVRTLDLATKQDDGANIAVVLWTPCDDNGEPFTAKQAENLHILADTADATATVAFHLNGNDTSNTSTTTAQIATDTGNIDVSGVSEFFQCQLRITGSFSTFIFRALLMRYLDYPLPQVYHDTGYVDLSTDGLRWVRRLRIKARTPVSLTVTPYWDGTAGTARTASVATYAGKTYVYEVPLGREDKGRTGRVVITSSSPSSVYWVEWVWSGSGKQVQKRVSLTPEAA